MNGEAADEVVRMVLNGSEVAIRLTGSAAKNLAAILVAWSKNHKKVYGKTSMMKLLRSGEELQVLSLTKEQYQDFKASARKQVLFAPFVDTKSEDGKVDVVIEAKTTTFLVLAEERRIIFDVFRSDVFKFKRLDQHFFNLCIQCRHKYVPIPKKMCPKYK